MKPARQFTALFILFFSLALSSQTDLVRLKNKTIARTDLLKIQRVTEFFPQLPQNFKYLTGSLICKAGGDVQTFELKSEILDSQLKEVLLYSDLNAKIYVDIKYLDRSSSPESVHTITMGAKIVD